MAVTLRTGSPADAGAVRALLAEADLPVADLEDAALTDFVLAEEDGRLVGTVAVQPHGAHGLLRSLAVTPAQRGRGLARRLIAAAEARARAQGLRDLTLLTTSAANLFAHHGYAVIARCAAAPALQSSPQFSQLCPATSTCLIKRLTENSA